MITELVNDLADALQGDSSLALERYLARIRESAYATLAAVIEGKPIPESDHGPAPPGWPVDAGGAEEIRRELLAKLGADQSKDERKQDE
jgi:hypothetical protein